VLDVRGTRRLVTSTSVLGIAEYGIVKS
jgi:hypothetical protein